MKKCGITGLGMVLLCSMLCGCVKVEVETDVPQKEEPDIREEFESYSYHSGSSSVCEDCILYVYGDDIICATEYFYCGDGLAETFVLSEEQKEAFLAQLDENIISKKEMKMDEELADGASFVEASVCIDGKEYAAKILDLEAAGIVLQDAGDVQYPDSEELSYEMEDILVISYYWEDYAFGFNQPEYKNMVGLQVEKLLGQPVLSMRVGDIGEDDYELEVMTEDGESHTLTVTHLGYVTE